MRVLLDTQVWLWMLAAPERLGAQARDLFDDVALTLVLSAASSWEIAIKHAVGRLELPESPERYVPDRMRASGVTPLAVEHSHALRVATLPHHHRDPFDRVLVAQAQIERMSIVTADPAIEAYEVEVIPAQ